MRTAIRHTVDFLLFSNCWVALSVATLVLGLAHYYCIVDCYLYGLFAFLGTFTTYNFHRMVRNRDFEQAAIETHRSRWISRNRTFLTVASALAAVTAGTLFFFLPIVFTSLVLLGITGLIVLFYAIPFPLIRRSLREVPGMKSGLIVLVWVVLVMIPLVNREKHIVWIDLVHIAALVYIQIIPFDLRDVAYDPPDMRTLPQTLGIQGTRWFATALTLLLGASLTYHHGFHWLILATITVSQIGLWWKQTQRNLPALELSWEGALIVLGIFYYTLPCLLSAS